METRLQKLFRYDAWANNEVLAAITSLTKPPSKSLRWLAHIIAAELVWMHRLRGEEPTLPVWPDLALRDCTERLSELPEMWSDYVAGLDAEDLTRSVSYTNSMRQRWTSTVEDILLHVVLHSAYHRGQIAADLRSSGGEPPYTDYILAIRAGLVE